MAALSAWIRGLWRAFLPADDKIGGLIMYGVAGATVRTCHARGRKRGERKRRYRYLVKQKLPSVGYDF